MNIVVGIVCIVVGLLAIIFNRAFDRFNQDHGNTGGKAQSGYNRIIFIVIGVAFAVAGVLFLARVFKM